MTATYWKGLKLQRLANYIIARSFSLHLMHHLMLGEQLVDSFVGKPRKNYFPLVIMFYLVYALNAGCFVSLWSSNFSLFSNVFIPLYSFPLEEHFDIHVK